MDDIVNSTQLVEVGVETVAEAGSLLAQAQACSIVDAASAQAAADLLTQEIAPRRKAVEEFFAPLVQQAFAAHRALTSRRSEVLAALVEPEKIVKEKLAAYAERERQREAELGLLAAESQGVKGVTMVERLEVIVDDFPALVRAVASGSAPELFLAPNVSEIERRAVALGEAFSVPGCRVEKRLVARRNGRA